MLSGKTKNYFVVTIFASIIPLNWKLCVMGWKLKLWSSWKIGHKSYYYKESVIGFAWFVHEFHLLKFSFLSLLKNDLGYILVCQVSIFFLNK